MKQFLFLLMAAFFFSASSNDNPSKPKSTPPDFVTVDGRQFKINDKSYRFIGANFWHAMYLGVGDQRERLLRELDQLSAIGCNNLRIMVASEGPETEPYRVQPPLMASPAEYNETILEGLDFLLVEMAKRKMYAVLVLGNFWCWSGGFSQMLSWADKTSIPYPGLDGTGIAWARYMEYTCKFYSHTEALGYYRAHVEKMVTRVNTITGTAYKDDPTIMSWQLANEPRAGLRVGPYRKWIKETAQLIRSLDPNHLISTGSEGLMSESMLSNQGRNYTNNHKIEEIDYLTVHVWIQNWGWYKPNDVDTLGGAQKKAIAYLDKHLKIGEKMNKPVVLEEFGISRDLENYAVEASIDARNAYFKFMFEYLEKQIEKRGVYQGINFWAWGGEGRPRVPKAVYQVGDDLIGDPPHEYQGWYSVYDRDTSTHELIKNFNDKIKGTEN